MSSGGPVAAAAPAGAAGAVAPGAAQQGGGGIKAMLFPIIRTIAMYWLMQKFFFGGGTNAPATTPGGKVVKGTGMVNLFQRGDLIDMHVYVTEFAPLGNHFEEQYLVWHEKDIPLGFFPQTKRQKHVKIKASESLQNNGTMYAHIFFTRKGFPHNKADPAYKRVATFGQTQPLVKYLPKKKIKQKINLLGGVVSEGDAANGSVAAAKEDASGADAAHDSALNATEETSIVSYWNHNLTINLVDDYSKYSPSSIPATIQPHMHVEATTGNYFPIIYFNEFWLLREHLTQLNDTVHELDLYLELDMITLMRWQLYSQIEQSFAMQQQFGSLGDGESDDIKRMFLEGNPYLLALTMIVSLLHTVFDFLAFKNDISFWRDNKSMEGLSARTIFMNCFCQTVIFLYLLDNETSWMILLSSGVGVLIEYWKISKACVVTIDRTGRFPRPRFADRESYAGNKTKEYDQQATRYLTYVLYPLVAAYSIYALVYDTHKSWYSWVINSLVGAVYMFGFIMMTPQLFINYKMKSVAHLPWRQMSYKFLNTIIDDLFAFIIKMPIMHRLSVFRDDVIFLIFLYQRWKYPVDKTRVNEFGFREADREERERAAAALAAGTPPGADGQLPALPAGEEATTADAEAKPDEVLLESPKEKDGKGALRRRKGKGEAASAVAGGGDEVSGDPPATSEGDAKGLDGPAKGAKKAAGPPKAGGASGASKPAGTGEADGETVPDEVLRSIARSAPGAVGKQLAERELAEMRARTVIIRHVAPEEGETGGSLRDRLEELVANLGLKGQVVVDSVRRLPGRADAPIVLVLATAQGRGLVLSKWGELPEELGWSVEEFLTPEQRRAAADSQEAAQ